MNWEDSNEREADMPNFDAFYDRLRTTDRLPTTSQPSIGDFLDVYEPLVDQGLDVGVDPHLRRHLGDGRERQPGQGAAATAAKGVDRVTVVDSESAAGGMGLVALAGARAAVGGGSTEEVVERIRATRRAA